MPNIRGLLERCVQMQGSDLHFKVDTGKVYVRVHGDLVYLDDVAAYSPEQFRNDLFSMLKPEQVERFKKIQELDFSFEVVGVSRFRGNAYQQRGVVQAAFRVIPYEIQNMEDLELPAACYDFIERPRGLVLVTGPAGSGKSTTQAAMVDRINRTRHDHIVTVEDPIEYTFRDKRSVINQRELGFDTQSFSRALRAALRQDPDVILVGEMRDNETAGIAITAAETGHLVLSTLHTADATETVNRIISMFPTHQQAQARLSLASVLRGVISQRLLPRADGKGMVPALEVLVNTERVREMIEDPARTREIKDAIAQGLHPYGMFTFDQSLANLVKQHLVTYDEAVKHSSSPSDFALLFRGVQGGGNQWQQGTTADAGDVAGGKGNDDFEIDRFTR